MKYCIVCQGSEFTSYWGGLSICANCGHCQANLDVMSLDFQQIYSENYFKGEEYLDYLNDRDVFEKQFQDRLKEIRHWQPGGCLIEVGCAFGFFLAAAKPYFAARGFDIAEEPVRHAREQLGVNAEWGDFVSANIASNSVDVVTLWDTIEHLANPDRVLEHVSRVLRPGGFVFLTTGDISSLLARLQREHWRLIHPPTHLHYFTPLTIQRLLNRFGIDVVQVRHVGTRRSIRQIAYSLFALEKKSSRLYKWIERSPFATWSFVLNSFDIMLVVGRKQCQKK